MTNVFFCCFLSLTGKVKYLSGQPSLHVRDVGEIANSGQASNAKVKNLETEEWHQIAGTTLQQQSEQVHRRKPHMLTEVKCTYYCTSNGITTLIFFLAQILHIWNITNKVHKSFLK